MSSLYIARVHDVTIMNPSLSSLRIALVHDDACMNNAASSLRITLGHDATFTQFPYLRSSLPLQETMTPGDLASVAMRHTGVDISGIDVVEAIEALMQSATLAHAACRRMRLNYMVKPHKYSLLSFAMLEKESKKGSSFILLLLCAVEYVS